MRGRRGGSIPVRGTIGVPATGCTFRAVGDAGATSGVGVLAIFRGVGDAGAQMRHTLAFRGVGDAGGGFRPIALFRGTSDAGAVSSSAVGYPNGFKNYIEFLIPEGSVFGTGAPVNYLGCIDETFPELRTVANGGLVEHASGFDQQLELADGTVLPFSRLLWDATTGRIVARARFATLPTTGARFRLFFGKTVTTDGANEGGAYAAHLMAPNIRTGADRTGVGRTFTATSITAGTLAGYAATFNGSSSQLVRTNPTELNGLSAITIQALVQLAGTAADKPIFIAGPNTGSDFGLHLRFRVSDGRLVFTIQVGASNTTVESQDDVMPAIGTPMLVAATWASGQAPKLFIDGEPLSLAVAGTALTGTTNATLGAAASEALIGFNRATSNRWNGQIADLMVSARALTGGHLQTQALNYLTPRQSYGVGAVNRATEINLSPVLPPIQATATVGSDAEVDPAAIAYEPEGQPKTLESHTGSAGGTFSIVGNRARFRPSSAGRWLSTAAVVDNGTPQKRSLGLILWTASSASTATFPKTPTGPFTATLRVPSEYPTIAAALAAASAGNRILVANGTYREAIDSNKSGSAAGGYIYIMAENHLGATLAGTTATNPLDRAPKSWKFTGSYIWISGFVSENPAQHSPDEDAAHLNKNYYFNSNLPETAFRLHGHHLRVTNCLIHSPQAIGIPADAHDIDVCYNTFTGLTQPRWNQTNTIYIGHFNYTSAGPRNVLIGRNKWFGDAEVTHTANDNSETRFCIYAGNSHLESDTLNVGVNRTVRVWENYVNVDFIGRGFYLKRTFDSRRNYIAVNRGGGTLQCFNLRHGGYSKPNGEVFPGLTNDTRGWIEGNNFAKGKVIINDTDHLILGNRFANDVDMYYGGQRWLYNKNTSTWEASGSEGWIQAASRVIFVGCQFHGKLTLGEDEGTDNTDDWKKSKPYRLTAGQGGVIEGVKCYQAGIASSLVPSETNGKLVRRKDWNNGKDYTNDNYTPVNAVRPGTAGYELLSGSSIWTPVPWIEAADLLNSGVGCDAA